MFLTKFEYDDGSVGIELREYRPCTGTMFRCTSISIYELDKKTMTLTDVTEKYADELEWGPL